MVIIKSDRQYTLKLLCTRRGSILYQIWPKIFFGMVMGVIAMLNYDGHFGKGLNEAITLAFAPFTALGVAVGLFLSFHNNASYDRWWEARKRFGDVIITMRDCTRFLLGALGPPQTNDVAVRRSSIESVADDKPGKVRITPDSIKFEAVADYADWRAKIVTLVMAHAHALRSQLRPHCASDETTALEDRDRWLSSKERRTVSASRNPANELLMMASRALGGARDRGEIDSLTFLHIAGYLDGLGRAQCSCECIHNTSVPLTYTLLVHRTTFLYVLLCPFAMVGVLGWWTPPFTAILSYTFFGLDELSRQIQEPFRDREACLHLSAMCRMIEIDVCEALGREVPPFLKPKRGVLM